MKTPVKVAGLCLTFALMAGCFTEPGCGLTTFNHYLGIPELHVQLLNGTFYEATITESSSTASNTLPGATSLDRNNSGIKNYPSKRINVGAIAEGDPVRFDATGRNRLANGEPDPQPFNVTVTCIFQKMTSTGPQVFLLQKAPDDPESVPRLACSGWGG